MTRDDFLLDEIGLAGIDREVDAMVEDRRFSCLRYFILLSTKRVRYNGCSDTHKYTPRTTSGHCIDGVGVTIETPYKGEGPVQLMLWRPNYFLLFWEVFDISPAQPASAVLRDLLHLPEGGERVWVVSRNAYSYPYERLAILFDVSQDMTELIV